MLRILFIFIFGAIAGGLAVWAFLVARGKGPGLIDRQAEEKKRNKAQILGILETQHPLTNNHVEQLLGISDATATRYLEELEREGKVRQVGDVGKGVFYEKVN